VTQENAVIIYTDGACSGNPGPGGWGSIIILRDQRVVELGAGARSTTNNRMELQAAISSLEKVKILDPHSEKIILLTDSVYVIHGIQKWIHGWRRNGWKNAEGTEVLNKDLWFQFFELAHGFFKGKMEYRYVRGHQGTPGNERCDEIAVAFSKGSVPFLFKGSLEEYSYPVIPLPVLQTIPENKNYGEKKKSAFSYLSILGNEVMRHRDWPSCERRVKGRSGAKFKKAMSFEDEISILKSWGASGVSIIDEK